jgi:DNA-binding MltR family transcriptional regulator
VTKDLLENTFSPLSSFAARINVTYSLGLISKEEWVDLTCLRKIRNEFAHEPFTKSFSDQSITDKIRNLKIPMLLKDLIPNFNDLPTRQLFINGASMIATFIEKRKRNNTEKRTSPRRFIMKHSRRRE